MWTQTMGLLLWVCTEDGVAQTGVLGGSLLLSLPRWAQGTLRGTSVFYPGSQLCCVSKLETDSLCLPPSPINVFTPWFSLGPIAFPPSALAST